MLGNMGAGARENRGWEEGEKRVGSWSSKRMGIGRKMQNAKCINQI